MKLSKKGAEKISTNCKNVTVIGTDDFFPPTILEGADKLEFEQSDFTGMVVLTVEEAKNIATLCGEAEFYTMQGDNHKAKHHVGKARDLLVERIEEVQENV